MSPFWPHSSEADLFFLFSGNKTRPEICENGSGELKETQESVRNDLLRNHHHPTGDYTTNQNARPCLIVSTNKYF